MTADGYRHAHQFRFPEVHSDLNKRRLRGMMGSVSPPRFNASRFPQLHDGLHVDEVKAHVTSDDDIIAEQCCRNLLPDAGSRRR